MKSRLVIDEETGTKRWFADSTILLHREDGPATITASGIKIWYKMGKCHRTDGPAVEWTDGEKFWYINGSRILPYLHLIEIPQTEDEMLEVFNQHKFVKFNDKYYFINQYIKKFKKEWYEKYRLLFK